MFKRLCLPLCLLVIALHSLSPSLPMPTSHAQDTPERPYSLYVPTTYSAATPMPLLMVLHGFASSGKALELMSGFDSLAEEKGFIVVYPNSVNTLNWNDGRTLSATLATADDSAYLLGLLDELSTEYMIAADQIYLTGFAAGGSMALRLACDAPERFAKVVTVSAAMWSFHVDEAICQPDGTPIEILSILGTEDPYYPLEGRTVETDPPIHTLIPTAMGEFWATRNGCDPASAEVVGSATIYCADGTHKSFTMYLLEGAGHFWARIGDYKLNQHDIDLTQTVFDFLQGTPIDYSQRINAIVNQGEPRNYTVYVPPMYDGSSPTPVVMALHGRPDNGYGFAFLSDMNTVAQTENFIVVYPDGYDEEWNYATGISGYPDPGTDDVQFLQDVLDDVGQTFNIDRARVYLMGFSNGGFMTQRVACEAPSTFAAYGIIGATLQVGFEEFCDGTPAVPLLFMHGSEDPSVAWSGITWQGQQLTLSTTDTLTYWAIHNGCAAESSQVVDLPSTDTTTPVKRFEFRGCADATQIDFYAIMGGGHTIPGVPERLPAAQFGLTTTNIYAPQILWDFFKQYP